MEVNELSVNAKGGTELMMDRLHSSLPSELLNKFQIIASRPRLILPNRKKVLWLHDLAQDPEVRHLAIPAEKAKYDLLVFVSNWQLQQYVNFLNVKYDESTVLENAIIPIDLQQHADKFDNVKEKGIKIIYTPTPHRGLEILVPVFKHLAEKYDNITLDVYSSFKLYGWDERDAPYKQLFDECRNHPKINYHGAVSNEEVREALKQAHIFAYPSIWPETSCLTLIEAMSAGCVCLHPNFAALPDTAAGQTFMYHWSEDINEHANRFAGILSGIIENIDNPSMINKVSATKFYADNRFDWNKRKYEWQAILENLANQTVSTLLST